MQFLLAQTPATDVPAVAVAPLSFGLHHSLPAQHGVYVLINSQASVADVHHLAEGMCNAVRAPCRLAEPSFAASSVA